MNEIIKRYAWVITWAAVVLCFVAIFLIAKCGTSKSDVAEPADTEYVYMSGCQIDTVLAVASYEGFYESSQGIIMYKKVKFTHDLCMVYQELSDPFKEQNDYNHPFYIENRDWCVVQVEFDNRGERKVTLLENLTKASDSNVEWYFGCYTDYD